jgi:hypothetical protein
MPVPDLIREGGRRPGWLFQENIEHELAKYFDRLSNQRQDAKANKIKEIYSLSLSNLF